MDGRATLKKNVGSGNDKTKKPAKKKKKTRRGQDAPANGSASSNSEAPASSPCKAAGKPRTAEPVGPGLQVVGERTECPIVISDGTGGTESDSSFSRNRKHKTPSNGARNLPKSTNSAKTLAVPSRSAKGKTKTNKSVLKTPTSTDIHPCSSEISVEEVSTNDQSDRESTTPHKKGPHSNTLPDMFNQTLRWEFELDDETAEEERVQRYKINRRNRYLANAKTTSSSLTCALPTITCTQNSQSAKSTERTTNSSQDVIQSAGYLNSTKTSTNHQLVLV